MNEFITWETLAIFASLVTVVFGITEFIKEIPYIKLLKTKYLSWIIAFVLITVSNIVLKTFVPVDIFLYAISAIFVSTSANGLSDFNNPVDKTKKE